MNKYSLDPKDWVLAKDFKGTEEQMKVLQKLEDNGVDLKKFYIMPEKA